MFAGLSEPSEQYGTLAFPPSFWVTADVHVEVVAAEKEP